MADLATRYRRDGFVVFDADPSVARWAQAARKLGRVIAADPDQQAKWLRHGRTWFVGVDALPNAADGSIDGVPLAGPWEGLASANAWHPAQLSVVYEGYPGRDPDESESAHRYRVTRSSAHVDGLHLEDRRRIVREPHAFILGLPLTESDACPLVVWRGSHRVIQAALAQRVGSSSPVGADVTEDYKAARARALESCERVEVQMRPGQSVLVNRFCLHGVAPWRPGTSVAPDGRMVAYFRPLVPVPDTWLHD